MPAEWIAFRTDDDMVDSINEEKIVAMFPRVLLMIVLFHRWHPGRTCFRADPHMVQ